MSPNPGRGAAVRRTKRDLFTGLAYGLGAVPFGAKTQLFGLLLLFYNQLLGLPAASVSAIIAASVVLDAVWDPLVGQISDTTRSRWGRRHPYLYGVAVPLAVAFALLWRPPAGWSQAALLAWLAVFTILTRLLVSLHELPSAALMPELTRDYDERTALVGLRNIFGNVGAGISFVLAFGVFLRSTPEHPFGQLNQAGYAPFGATIAGVMLVTILLSALGTHRVIPALYAPRPQIGGTVPRLRAIGQTLRSRNFAAIAAAGLLHGINLGVHGGLAIYFTTYYWQLPAEKILWLGLLAGPAHPLAAFFAPVLAKRWGKRDACVGLFLAAIALANLPLVASLLGWLPAASSAALFAILLADLSVVMFIGTSAHIIVTSMVADIVEETELRTGRRSEGLLLAAETFLKKLSAGMAIAVPGLLLALVAFPPHADPATLDPEIMRRLAFFSLPLWVALSLAATGVLLFYRIDRRTHEANLAKLTPETDGSIPPNPVMDRFTIVLAALAMSFAGAGAAAAQTGQSPMIVTRDNFTRAETDFYFAQIVRGGGFGRLVHRREMALVDRQDIVRMNRDTLYSAGVFDLAAAPATITLPDPGRRYMSLQVISEDQYTPLVAYAPGRYAIDEARAGTHYAMLLVRTLADPRRADDLAAAHRLQDAIVVEQPSAGTFAVPDWDSASREAVHEELAALSRQQRVDSGRMFGAKGEVEPLPYLIGAATGWGGLPRSAAVYDSGAVARNDGKTVYRLTVHKVPVDGFWSISVYNRAGYFEKTELDGYSVNNVTAAPNADGSVTVQFGGCNRDIVNCLAIMPGWNYTVRLYRPRAEVLGGAWSFPKPQPVE